MKRPLAVLVALLALVAAPTAQAAFTTTEHVVTMDDGAGIAATLYVPAGTSQTTFPAVMLFHGIGNNRQTVAPVAARLADNGYVALAFDFRGHGQSGGLFTGLGARDLADIAILREAWLPANAPVDGARIGGWGDSLGGGALLRSIAEGTPFAAAVVVETWTDLYEGLSPQGLPKSGAIFGFLNSVPAERQAPELLAVRDSVARRDVPALRAFSNARSTRHLLGRGFPPTYFFQGRRDFAFGLDQGLSAFRALGGQKAVYIGAFGHAPSRFPGPDIETVVQRTLQWYGSYLRGLPAPPDLPPVELAPDPFTGRTVGYNAPPPTRTLSFALNGRATIGSEGKVVRRVRLGRQLRETFGAPTVRVQASSTTGWSHLVAVLVARTPRGETIVVSQGGAPTALTGRARPVTIRLISQVTRIPANSRLELTLAGTSTAQHPANLLYLVPVASRARVTLGNARLTLPVLRTPVSR